MTKSAVIVFVCDLILGACDLAGVYPCLCLCRALLQTT